MSNFQPSSNGSDGTAWLYALHERYLPASDLLNVIDKVLVVWLPSLDVCSIFIYLFFQTTNFYLKKGYKEKERVWKRKLIRTKNVSLTRKYKILIFIYIICYLSNVLNFFYKFDFTFANFIILLEIKKNQRKILTVSVVFSSLCPSCHHVITAGGLEPALWHNKSYLRPADNGWCAPSNLIFNGATKYEK